MKDLFGNEVHLLPDEKRPIRLAEKQHIQLMNAYGSIQERCKNCIHFYSKQFAGRFFKCDKAHRSNGTATDWRANWQACGLFESQNK